MFVRIIHSARLRDLVRFVQNHQGSIGIGFPCLFYIQNIFDEPTPSIRHTIFLVRDFPQAIGVFSPEEIY